MPCFVQKERSAKVNVKYFQCITHTNNVRFWREKVKTARQKYRKKDFLSFSVELLWHHSDITVFPGSCTNHVVGFPPHLMMQLDRAGKHSQDESVVTSLVESITPAPYSSTPTCSLTACSFVNELASDWWAISLHIS